MMYRRGNPPLADAAVCLQSPYAQGRSKQVGSERTDEEKTHLSDPVVLCSILKEL